MLDSDWEYQEEFDSYNYVGDKNNQSILVGLTMTHTKCIGGKCMAFYVVGASYSQGEDGNYTANYYIDHWASGLPQIKPVINVYKSSLK